MPQGLLVVQLIFLHDSTLYFDASHTIKYIVFMGVDASSRLHCVLYITVLVLQEFLEQVQLYAIHFKMW